LTSVQYEFLLLRDGDAIRLRKRRREAAAVSCWLTDYIVEGAAYIAGFKKVRPSPSAGMTTASCRAMLERDPKSLNQKGVFMDAVV
jgi:hypothetical protein